jgi:hypothetical protein
MAIEYDRILNRTFQASTNGATINTGATALWPVLRRIGTFSFDVDSACLALVMSSSLLNTGTGVMAVAAARGESEFLNLTPPVDPRIAATDVFLTQLTHLNSTAATSAPASRTTAISFSPSVAVIEFKSGDSISLYAAADNLATALITSSLSIYYIPV